MSIRFWWYGIKFHDLGQIYQLNLTLVLVVHHCTCSRRCSQPISNTLIQGTWWTMLLAMWTMWTNNFPKLLVTNQLFLSMYHSMYQNSSSRESVNNLRNVSLRVMGIIHCIHSIKQTVKRGGLIRWKFEIFNENKDMKITRTVQIQYAICKLAVCA